MWNESCWSLFILSPCNCRLSHQGQNKLAHTELPTYTHAFSAKKFIFLLNFYQNTISESNWQGSTGSSLVPNRQWDITWSILWPSSSTFICITRPLQTNFSDFVAEASLNMKLKKKKKKKKKNMEIWNCPQMNVTGPQACWKWLSEGGLFSTTFRRNFINPTYIYIRAYWTIYMVSLHYSVHKSIIKLKKMYSNGLKFIC